MAEQFDLNNLVLDDNSFDTVPDGDYHFTVESHELDYYSGNSEKIPPNTQQIICHLSVPFEKDGEIKTAKIRTTFNVYRKALFAIRQFAECIGMCPEKGQFHFDHNKIDGLSGVCQISKGTSSKGNEFNQVDLFYPPSKVPVVTANGDAWKKRDDFTALGENAYDPFTSLPE